MGTYVDVYAFEIEKLKNRLEKHYDDKAELVEGKMRPSEFLDIVMPEYGTIVGDYFIIVSNEHSEEFNAWFGFDQLLGRYYGKDPESTYRGLFDLHYLDGLDKVTIDSYGPEWKDEDEWAELGIPNMPEEWDE